MASVVDFSFMNNVGNMTDMIWIGICITIGVILFAWMLWKLADYFSYNIQVNIKRQVGEAYINAQNHKIIPVHSFNTKGKIYSKKIKKDTSIEYFKILGTDFDYRNYFPEEAFYTRDRLGVIDTCKKGIDILLNRNGAFIPLTVSNPAMINANVNMNEIISAVADSMKERDEYSTDFWDKYGNIITLAFLMAFFVVGMIFIIKYQEVFWEKSMGQLQTILQTLKDTARPELPAQLPAQ